MTLNAGRGAPGIRRGTRVVMLVVLLMLVAGAVAAFIIVRQSARLAGPKEVGRAFRAQVDDELATKGRALRTVATECAESGTPREYNCIVTYDDYVTPDLFQVTVDQARETFTFRWIARM